MTQPKYSFIVPTYNRLEELKELITSLDQLDFDHSKYELIIVDDGSTDGTSEYINSLQSKYFIKYQQQQNEGPGPARNNGMTIAAGQFFLFIDSDCMLPKSYLLEVDLALSKYSFDSFGGPDTYHYSFSPLLKAINYSMTSFLGTGGTRGSTKSVTKFYPRSFNMGISRGIYESIGEFSTLRHGQDMDYSARIYTAGFKVGFIEKAYVYHKRRTSMWRFFKQIHNWGVTRINLGTAHKQMLKPIHLAPAFIVVGVIFLSLSSIWIESARPLLMLTFIGAGIIALAAFIQSYRIYHSIKISLLSIITLFWQILAYGLGTLNGIWQKLILRRQTAIGITKNYYK